MDGELPMDTELLLAALAFIIPMCFTPGPNNILCAAHGSKFGVKASLPMIFGMGIGWSLLGILIGIATDSIEKYKTVFDALGVVGALYIAYIGVGVMRSSSVKSEHVDERLGFKTGFMLQLVNGKAWIHFLVLMTTFGALFGAGVISKVLLVLLNLSFGWPAVLTWAAFGSYLRSLFTSERSGKRLNQIFGIALIGVAAYLVVV
jgi:threonine/homoserine/homoserine lactone efflux protein